MATVAQQNDDQTQKNASGPTAVNGTGGAGTSGQGAQGGASGPVSPVQQNPNPQTSQGYTDVGSYLNANQGGANQLGQQVSQNVTNQYNQTKSGIDTSLGNFQTQVNAGYTPENTQLIQSVAANPTTAVSNNQTGAFQRQLNDIYGGPTAWSDYGTQQGNVANAQQYGDLANTPGGLNIYTQQAEAQTGGPQSQGINQLDTLLLGGTPGAVQQIQQAASPYAGLTDYLNSQNTAAGQTVTGAQQNATQASQDALNAFTGQNGTLTNLNNQINATTASDLAQAQAQQTQLQTDLANLETPGDIANQQLGIQNYNVGTLSPQDVAALGLTQDQANQLRASLVNAGTSQYETGHNFGASSATEALPLMQYLQQQNPNTAVNPATVATPQQYQEMAAIQQLLGSQTPSGLAINPLNANLAGTYNPNNLNTFDYNAATTAANNFATNAQQTAQQQANAQTAAMNAQHDAGKGGFLSSITNNPIAQYLANPLTQVPAELKKAGVK